MPQRVIFNLPPYTGDAAGDVSVLADVVPAVDDTVTVDGATYRVCKVLHVVHTFGGVRRAREPVVYLAESRAPSSTEAAYAKKLSD